MDRTEEKLLAFTDMVLKDAARRKQEILDHAEAACKEMVEAGELQLLKSAHDDIQDSLRAMGRASNEEVSRTILESKQALFTRREEIIDAVFMNVAARIDAFRKTPDYREYLRRRILEGFSTVGQGDVRVLVDEEDRQLAESLQAELDRKFQVGDAQDVLGGGCLFVNRTTGRMCDFSLLRQMDVERQAFLQRYELSLEG